MRKIRNLLLAVCLTLICVYSTHAQSEKNVAIPAPSPTATVTSPPPNPSPGDSDAVTEAKILARLRYFEVKSDADDKVHTADLSAIDALQRLDTSNQIVIKYLQKAADKGIEAGDIAEQKVIPQFSQILHTCQLEVTRLLGREAELQSARDGAFKYGLLLGGAGGAGVAWIAKPCTCPRQ